MNAAIQYVKKLALALVVLGSLALAHSASAVNIDMNIYLSRYGYVSVRPKANTGGAILWDASKWCWYTDRAMRGERLYVFLWPTAGEVTGVNTAYYGIWCGSQNRFLVSLRYAPWMGSCWYFEYVVPTDPYKDYLEVDVITNPTSPTPSLKTKEIPIGTR